MELLNEIDDVKFMAKDYIVIEVIVSFCRKLDKKGELIDGIPPIVVSFADIKKRINNE